MSEEITQKLPDSPDGLLKQILTAVQELGDRITGVESAVGNLDSRLIKMEQTVEARLYDTRPMWETLIARVEHLEQGQELLLKKQDELQQELLQKQDDVRFELRNELRNLSRQFSVLNDTFMEIRADYKDLDRRVYQIEEPHS